MSRERLATARFSQTLSATVVMSLLACRSAGHLRVESAVSPINDRSPAIELALHVSSAETVWLGTQHDGGQVFLQGPLLGVAYNDGRVRFSETVLLSPLADVVQCDSSRWFVTNGIHVWMTDTDVAGALQPVPLPPTTVGRPARSPCKQALFLDAETPLVTDGNSFQTLANLAPYSVMRAAFESLTSGSILRSDDVVLRTENAGRTWTPLDSETPVARALHNLSRTVEEPSAALTQHVLEQTRRWETEHTPSNQWQPTIRSDGGVYDVEGGDLLLRDGWAGHIRSRAQIPLNFRLYLHNHEPDITTFSQSPEGTQRAACVLREWGDEAIVLCTQNTLHAGNNGSVSSSTQVFQWSDNGLWRELTEPAHTASRIAVDPSGESLLEVKLRPTERTGIPSIIRVFRREDKTWRTLQQAVNSTAFLGVRYPYAYFEEPAGRLDLANDRWEPLERFCTQDPVVEHARMFSDGTLLVRCTNNQSHRTVVRVNALLERRELGDGSFGFIPPHTLVRDRGNSIEFSDDQGNTWYGELRSEQLSSWRVETERSVDSSALDSPNAPGWLYCGDDGCVFPDGSILLGSVRPDRLPVVKHVVLVDPH